MRPSWWQMTRIERDGEKKHDDSLRGCPGCQWAAPVTGCVSTFWVCGSAQLDHSGLPVSPRCCPCPPPHRLSCFHHSMGCFPCWCVLWRMQFCSQTEKKTVRKRDICLPSHPLCGTLWSVFISLTWAEMLQETKWQGHLDMSFTYTFTSS